MKSGSWFGWFIAIGGLVWIAVWTTYGLRPSAPPGGYREAEDMNGIFIVSQVFIALGMLGTVLWNKSFSSRSLKMGGWLVALASACMGLGRTFQQFGGEPQPYVFIGLFTLWIGVFALGFASFTGENHARSRNVLFLIAGVCLLFLNDQDWRAWFALPFGAAMTWLGITLGARFNRDRCETPR